MIEQPKLGKKISDLRKAKGFTQEELETISKKVGFSNFIFERVFIYKRDYGEFPIFNFYAKKL